MKIVISKTPRFNSSPQISHPNLLISFPSLSLRNRSYSHQTLLQISKAPTFFSSVRAFCASETASYGGWDDLIISGESDRLRSFLASVGIDDKKHVFTFLLGLVCALAISRVRVSSIVVFPASFLVFAVGFYVGYVRGGIISGSNRKAKDEIFRVLTEKLRSFVHFVDGFDAKVSYLKNSLLTAIDNKKVTVSDLESYVQGMESIRVLAQNARSDAHDSMNYLGSSYDVLVENQKPSRRRKDLRDVGFDLLQILRHSILGVSVGKAKPNKVKDNVQQENASDLSQKNSLIPGDGENVLWSINDNDENYAVSSLDSSSKSVLDRRVVPGKRKINLGEIDRSTKRSTFNEEYSYKNKRLSLMNSQRVSLKMGNSDGSETWEPHDSSLDYVDFQVSIKQMRNKSSIAQEQILRKSSGAYRFSESRRQSENKPYRSLFGEGTEGESTPVDIISGLESEVGPSSSSVVSDDMVFDRYLTEANGLLNEAKGCLRGYEERAEVILYKSAELLSKAIAMKPMSLLAVGLLGNTYLLRGELKLKISRELRTHLSKGIPISVEKWGLLLKGLDDQVVTKEKTASVLIDVCEECEELLVEAGRLYRKALSIDGNDVRALYNWGLALSFRAQLIADVGPEAALDADTMFLAAIDKFDAMMSKGNVYAPDALFRWGVALQLRSRLRSSDSKEKVKLLQQAKRLYEDALDMDSGNFQVREALSSCTSELNLRI